MKTVKLFFLLFIAFCNSIYSQSPNAGGKWVGKYSYEEPGPVTYDLKIRDDNSCVYEGVGTQTFFEIECKGKVSGETYEIYFVKTKDGVYLSEDGLEKKMPFIILSYKNKVLYTAEPQLGDPPSSKKFKKKS